MRTHVSYGQRHCGRSARVVFTVRCTHPETRSMPASGPSIPLTLAQARKLPCIAKNGSPIAFTTMLRWCREGVNGVRLSFRRIGKSLCTTEADVLRFIQLVTEATDGPPPPQPVSQAEYEARAKRAAEALQAAGI